MVRRRKDNLYQVMVCTPRSRPDKVRAMRLLGGKFGTGTRVTLAKDVFPLRKARYFVRAVVDGLPYVIPISAAESEMGDRLQRKLSVSGAPALER